MLIALRHSLIARFIWGFMAFYLLNISVDVSSFFVENKKALLNHNEQESIIEIVFEKVLGFEQAIPENNTDDSEQNPNIKKGFSIDHFVLSFYEIKTKIFVFDLIEKNFYYSKNIFLKPSLEIHSPPPEV